MNSPRSQFPLWIFIVTDLALLGVAAVISAQAPRPFSQATILWVVTCVVLGVLVGLVPIIWHFEHKKNEALDDRQRALEALARTVSSSAEQISIATGGLHEITDLAQKNLRQADQLPHRLQEKIAEFQAQLAQANDTEKEELERELLALRTSETERLEAASQRIAKTSAEWVKLEAATALHLVSVTDGLTRLAQGTAESINRTHATAEHALAHARIEAARSWSEASTHAVKAIEAARAAALENITQQLTALIASVAHDAATQIAARLASSSAVLEAQIARLEASRNAALTVSPVSITSEPRSETEKPMAERTANSVAATPVETPAESTLQPSAPLATSPEPASDSSEVPGSPPSTQAPQKPATPAAKRTRKPKREEVPTPNPRGPDPIVTPAPEPIAENFASTPREPAMASASESVNGHGQRSGTAASEVESTPAVPPLSSRSETPAVIEPTAAAPVPTPLISTSAPVLPAPVPVADVAAASPSTTPPVATASGAETAAEADGGIKPAGRKRAAKKSPDDDTPALDLGLEESEFTETNSKAMRGMMERVLTSDGATRLLVTAYIGIGNRLFIRGEGPGLSWERGVPLEFVSIGKWRWQTNDATQPVRFKIYKNDELESPSLGQQAVDPGYQQDVTAGF